MTFRNTGNAVNVFGTRNTCRFIVYSSILFSRSPGGGGGGYVSVVSNDEMQSFQQNGYHDDEELILLLKMDIIILRMILRCLARESKFILKQS